MDKMYLFDIPICKECGSNTNQLGFVNRVSADIETTSGTVGLYMCGGCMALSEGSEIYYLDGVEVGRGDDPVDDYDSYEIDDSRYDEEFKNQCEFVDESIPYASAFRKLINTQYNGGIDTPIPVLELTSLCDQYLIPYQFRSLL